MTCTRAFGEHPRDPRVDGAEAQVARRGPGRACRAGTRSWWPRRWARSRRPSALQLEAAADRAQVLPAEPGPDGLARRPVPDDRRPALVGDPDRVDGPTVRGRASVAGACGARPRRAGAGRTRRGPGAGESGSDAPPSARRRREPSLVDDRRRAPTTCPTSTTSRHHGQARSRRRGRGGRACRGSGCRSGRAPASPRRARRSARPSASRTKRARLSPTPWWWLSAPPCASTARVPASHAAAVERRPRVGGVGLTREREVEARAVGVASATGARDADERARHRPRSRRSRRRRSVRSAPTAPRSPSCRRRSPREISASSALTSLRCPIHCSTSAVVEHLAPASSALLGDDGHRRVDDQRGRPRPARAARAGRRSGSCGRLRSRRRGGSPRAWRRDAGSAGTRRARRRTTRTRTRRAARTAGAGCSRRRAPVMMPSVPSRADEELGQVGPDRGTRRAAGVDRAAVGEHDVEADDHVLDLPVAGADLARAAAREPAADGRQVDRLGPVPDRHAVLGAQRRLRATCRTCRAVRRGSSSPGRRRRCR